MRGARRRTLKTLHRNGGFNGVKRKAVSALIARPDPRRQRALAGA